jgi:ribosomal protein S18 acetylase RimI-like enzyme
MTRSVESEIVVRPAGVTDLESIAVIHSRAFPGFFLTDLGPAVLRLYYGTVLNHASGVLLLAHCGGRPAGFVCGFSSQSDFYAAWTKQKWRVLMVAAPALLRDPRRIARLLVGYRWSRSLEVRCGKDRAELSSIAVAPEFAACGIGTNLLQGFREVLVRRAADSYELTTDALDNDPVNAFYVRQGLTLQGQVRRGPRVLNLYVDDISQGLFDSQLSSE